jgi:hypothetical protein
MIICKSYTMIYRSIIVRRYIDSLIDREIERWIDSRYIYR